MALGYYPNQKVSYNSIVLALVQNVNIDFNLKKNIINEFGNRNGVGYVSFEGPTLNTTIEYYANVGEGLNLDAFGLSNIYSVINEPEGRRCVFSHDGGSLTTTYNYITNYSIKGQVGSIPTVAVSSIGLSGSYVVGGSAQAGQPTDRNAMTPQSINLNGRTAKSFNCSLNIPRQIFYELGTDIALGVVATEPPKITVDLEIILGGATDIDSLAEISISSAGSGPLFQASSLKVTKYSTKGSVNGVAVSNVSLEGLFKDNNCTIYY